MGALEKRIERLELTPPPPPQLSIDEKTNAYIEKLTSDNEVEFVSPVTVKLDDFDGPLDLLLFLVKKEKVSIEDVFISKITDQYIQIIKQSEHLDLETASEFIEIAAILLEIKAKALLPQQILPQTDETDSKKELIRRLEEYRLYKEASEKLKQFETTGMFFKPPDSSLTDPTVILKDMTMEGLLKAINKMFLRLEQKGAADTGSKKIVLDRFTVSEKIDHIKDFLTVRKKASFFELFEDENYSKSEIITTFQALLELLKTQEVEAEQQEVYGDIIIKRREE